MTANKDEVAALVEAARNLRRASAHAITAADAASIGGDDERRRGTARTQIVQARAEIDEALRLLNRVDMVLA